MRICGPIWARLGNIVQQPNFAYITQPISRSLPVRGIFPCPVANGIEIKRKTRHAARTASTCFGTSTTLFERWRHIASTLIKMSIGLYRENAIAIEGEARDPFGSNVYYVTMQITFHIPEFARKERNLHCDVVHVTTKWVSRLVLDHAIAAIQTSR